MSSTPKVTFGTASAPVSRQASRQDGEQTDDDHSPLSSGRTATETEPQDMPMVRAQDGNLYYVDTDIHDPAMVEASHPEDLSPTAPEHARPAGLGSMSAPSSPHARNEDGSTGFPLTTQQSAVDTLAEPTAAGVPMGLAQPNSEPLSRQSTGGLTTGSVGQDGIRRKDHHHHHHHSGRSTPYMDPYYGGRAPGKNAKPAVFSLARPIPTKEQRDAQKAYREEVRARLVAKQGGHPLPAHGTASAPNRSAASSRASSRHGHHRSSHAPLVGPGAMHHGGVPGVYPVQYYPPPRHSHQSLGGQPDKAELMVMLRQLLNEGDGSGAGKLENGGEGATEIREDNADNKGNVSAKAIQNTRRAERSDSLSSSSSSCSSDSDDEEEVFPNPWARFRHTMREPFAEFLGTMILIIFGTGVSLQYFLSLDTDIASSPRGTYLSVSFGWGIGVGMGVWVAGGISGGHINPAVTVALAIFRGFPWKKVPGYVLAQVLGSMTGAGITYALYRRAITIFEGNARTVSGPTATAALFATYPLEYVTDANAFFNEFVDAAILLMVVLAISDTNNASPPDGLNPLVLFLLITGIGAALGMQTAYCINPARDIGPRLVTWFAGYGREVWDFRNQYWLWTPVLATMSGALFGALIYDTFIYTGAESPLNMKWTFPGKKREVDPEIAPASKEKMPAGQLEPGQSYEN